VISTIVVNLLVHQWKGEECIVLKMILSLSNALSAIRVLATPKLNRLSWIRLVKEVLGKFEYINQLLSSV